MPVFYQFGHILVKERHQKGCDVRAVNIGIGHDNNFFITQIFFFIVVFSSATQRFNHIFDFLVLRNFIQTGAGNVEDFSSQRQNRLRHPVASLFGGAARRVALNDKNFRIFRRRFGTIGKFPRQTQFFRRRLAVLYFFFFSLFAQFSAVNNIFNQRGGVFLV